MTPIKLRKTLILLHLYFAGFMAPAFILVAVSGGLYLLGNKGQVTSTPIELVENASLDFKSPTIADDVRAMLSASGVDHEFEYVKDRGQTIELRPTSRTYLSIKQTEAGLVATRHKPDFQKSMIELHKGHGPKLFKLYQKLVALALILVVLGGVLVGLLAAGFRKQTLVASGVGLIAFLGLALL